MTINSILLALNVMSFAAYGADKSYARLGSRRIPEKVFLVLAVLGAAGAYLGMLMFNLLLSIRNAW